MTTNTKQKKVIKKQTLWRQEARVGPGFGFVILNTNLLDLDPVKIGPDLQPCHSIEIFLMMCLDQLLTYLQYSILSQVGCIKKLARVLFKTYCAAVKKLAKKDYENLNHKQVGRYLPTVLNYLEQFKIP